MDKGLLRVQHIAAERLLGSQLPHPCEIKQDSQHGWKLQASYKELWAVQNSWNPEFVTVDHADANWVVLIFQCGKSQKGKC